jgi:transmembrane sensor
MNQELITKYLSGDCSEEESSALLKWVESSEDNKQNFAKLKNVWSLAGMEDIPDDKQILQNQFEILIHRLNISESFPTHLVNEKPAIRLSEFKKIAASIIITIGITACLSYFIWHKPSLPVTYNELVVPCGQQAQLTLADGTKIWLNSKSKLIYPGTFSDKMRIVKLEGEGYFQVSHNPNQPFIVKTSHINVKVLGTSFNISSYSNDKEIKLALETGKVALSEPGKKEVINIIPSELAVYSKSSKTVSITKVETSLYTSWLKGQFKFRNMSFEEISKRLGRNFNVEFVFSKESIKQVKYSGSFYNYESLDQILKIMITNSFFKYKIKQNKVFID